MQKWEMITSHICQAKSPCRACVKKVPPNAAASRMPESREARLGADEDVELSGRVGEVGTHERVWHAEEVEEGLVLDC
jgi:hypothetical protein